MSQAHAVAGQSGAVHLDVTAGIKDAARVWAAVLLVGVVCGVLVVGGLGRLVMFLLASINPDAAGVRSDDGFIMGQFTLSGSAQLAGSGAQIGAVAAFIYVAVRGLMIGPGWLRLLSISVGPGVVVGAILVHTTGVDFNILEPLWLTIGSFVLLPVVFCAALHVLAERSLAGAGVRFKPLLVPGLLPAAAVFPLTLILGIGWWAARAFRATGVHSTGVWAWALRAALAVMFLLAVVNLISDARTLSA